MMARRKGQIAGQIFIYILAIIVIGGIVLVGFWAVKMIQEKMCQVAQINFKTGFEKVLKDSNTYGKVSLESVPAPCNFNKLCLIDATRNSTPSFNAQCNENKIVNESVNSGQKMNIFIVGSKATFPVGYSTQLILEDPTKCLCINVENGQFHMRLEGNGPSTKVKKVAPGTGSLQNELPVS